jgi:hypothetical protein
MSLTKIQTAVACLIVVAAPVAYQWNALNRAKKEQQRLNTDLTKLRQGINLQARGDATLERRLHYANTTLADLQSALGSAKLAAVREAASPANLYLWDEQSDYVRLPRSFASHLRFGEFQMQPRRKANPQRAQRPPIANDGTPSPALLDALGLTTEEAQRVSDIIGNAFTEFTTLATSHSYFTNLDFSMTANIEHQTWFTPAFPEEGQRFRNSFFNSLVQMIGEERAQMIWQQAESVFGDLLNNFGQATKAVTVARVANGGVEIGEGYFRPDGSFRAGRSDSTIEVPAALKPFVEAWKKPGEPQTGGNQQ